MLCSVRVFGTVCGVPCGIRLWIGKFWGQEELCSRGKRRIPAERLCWGKEKGCNVQGVPRRI